MSTTPVAATPQTIQQTRRTIADMKAQVKTLLHKDPYAAAQLTAHLNRADANAAAGKMYSVKEDLKHYTQGVHNLTTAHAGPQGSVAPHGYVAGSGMAPQHGLHGQYGHTAAQGVRASPYATNNAYAHPAAPAHPTLNANEAGKMNYMTKTLDRKLNLGLGIR